MPETTADFPSNPEKRDELHSMSFLEHLEELRRRLIYSFIAVGVGFFFCWGFADRIYGLMQKPIVAALHNHHMPEQLVYLSPTEPFNLYLKIGLMAGIFVASPFVLFQIWMFIAPGLYRKEKSYVVPFMISTVLLFLAGGFFGYRIVFPAALDFLIGYGSQFHPMITIGEYTDLFLTVLLGLGAVFEMPILVFFLALMGIVTPGWMLRNFRYSILIIFLIAAVLTPTTDIVNMCVFAAPMILLYIVSIGVAWLVTRGRRKAKS